EFLAWRGGEASRAAPRVGDEPDVSGVDEGDLVFGDVGVPEHAGLGGDVGQAREGGAGHGEKESGRGEAADGEREMGHGQNPSMDAGSDSAKSAEDSGDFERVF